MPYGDPRAPFEKKCAYDMVDYGLGNCANSLELGCDCLGHIRYFDGMLCDSKGALQCSPNEDVSQGGSCVRAEQVCLGHVCSFDSMLCDGKGAPAVEPSAAALQWCLGPAAACGGCCNAAVLALRSCPRGSLGFMVHACSPGCRDRAVLAEASCQLYLRAWLSKGLGNSLLSGCSRVSIQC